MDIQNPNTWVIGIRDADDDRVFHFTREELSDSGRRLLESLDYEDAIIFNDIAIGHIPLENDPLPFEGRVYGHILVPRVEDDELLPTLCGNDLGVRIQKVQKAFELFGFSSADARHIMLFACRTARRT